MGGAALHFGNVAEMKTGEGKTLTVCCPPISTRSAGNGVHVVTVNDYLAKRDAEWMGRVHRFLGPRRRRHPCPDDARPSGASPMPPTSPTAPTTSSASTTCATTWPTRLDGLVQRGHDYAIVDEVDSILIDEARTPLIISGPADGASNWYTEFARIGAADGEGHPLRGRPAQAHRRRARGGQSSSSRTSSVSTTSTRPPTRRWSATSTTR